MVENCQNNNDNIFCVYDEQNKRYIITFRQNKFFIKQIWGNYIVFANEHIPLIDKINGLISVNSKKYDTIGKILEKYIKLYNDQEKNFSRSICQKPAKKMGKRLFQR